MSDLSDFLLARIAEDEAVSRAVDAKTFQSSLYQSRDVSREAVDFTLQFGPARMLAECEAKRQVVVLLQTALDVAVAARSAADYSPASAGSELISRAALLRLAEPYSAHADYREQWRIDDDSMPREQHGPTADYGDG